MEATPICKKYFWNEGQNAENYLIITKSVYLNVTDMMLYVIFDHAFYINDKVNESFSHYFILATLNEHCAVLTNCSARQLKVWQLFHPLIQDMFLISA